MYLRYDFARGVLFTLGVRTPSSAALAFLAAWTVLETAPPTLTAPGARYNLLNTRHSMPGSTNFNGAGVQNFLTFGDGCHATVNALRDGFYPQTLAALTTGDDAALGFPNGPLPDALVAELAKWSGGSQYGTRLFAVLGRGTTDTFPGENSYWKEIQAHTIWNSVLSADYSTPIALAWRALCLKGMKPGPPLTPAYAGSDWFGTPLTFQEFSNIHAEQNAAGAVRLFDLSGTLVV